MRKRALDLTFDELAQAGRQASVDAIARAHDLGLATLSANEDGQLVRTYPDGRIEPVPSSEPKPSSGGRRKSAA